MLSVPTIRRALRRGGLCAAVFVLLLSGASRAAADDAIKVRIQGGEASGMAGLRVSALHLPVPVGGDFTQRIDTRGEATVPLPQGRHGGYLLSIAGTTALGERINYVRYVRTTPGGDNTVVIDANDLFRVPELGHPPPLTPKEIANRLGAALRTAEAAGRQTEAAVYRGALQQLLNMVKKARDGARYGGGPVNRTTMILLEENVLACQRALAAGGGGGGAAANAELLGTWRMTPISIKNPALCGNVTYHADIVIQRRVSDGLYTGISPFRWDLSRADPACRFKFHRTGTARVEIVRDGDRITIKYRYAGPNTYADDTVTLNGRIMSGRDASGETVTFTKVD